jgi:(2R)-3-sulfolactate dehydrogenase (NADP+)
VSAVRLSVAQAHALVAAALTASATSIENADAVSRALVGAELCGQAGHGLRRVAAYAAQSRSGKVDGRASSVALRVRPGVIHIDARRGFAYPALELAVAELAQATPGQGIVMAGIARSHHAGVAGLTVEALAERGFLALMFANSPAAMAPWGGTRPLFGTNPIAFACPVEGGEPPVVVDVSLSKVARGRIMAAAQKGEAIPEGWALDAKGQPTTDAKAALKGTMNPLGDAKGAALALMVELLAAGLTGANYAYDQTSFFDAHGAPPGTGQAIIAIDPGAFGPGALRRFSAMAEAVAGSAGARLPGRRRYALRQELERDGIPVDAALLAELEAIASG